MKIKLKSDLLSGILSVVFAVGLWIVIPYQIVDVSNKLIKSDFLPRLLAIIILICGIWLIVDSKRKSDNEKIIEVDLKKELRVLIYMAALIAYVVLFGKIGFLFSSMLLAIFTLIFVRDKKMAHYIVVLVYVTAIFFIFKYLLGIPLPTLFLR